MSDQQLTLSGRSLLVWGIMALFGISNPAQGGRLLDGLNQARPKKIPAISAQSEAGQLINQLDKITSSTIEILSGFSLQSDTTKRKTVRKVLQQVQRLQRDAQNIFKELQPILHPVLFEALLAGNDFVLALHIPKLKKLFEEVVANGEPECASWNKNATAPRSMAWFWKRIGFDEAEVAKNYPGLTVALIDTGIDALHPELQGQLWLNQKEIPFNNKDDDGNGYMDDHYGWDFAARKPSIQDIHGHGTYSAGILAARWDRGKIKGINPHVKLMVLKVTNLAGFAGEKPVAEAIRYAVQQGAKILQISICIRKRSKVIEQAVQWAIKKGALIIACANSHGKNINTISPAGIPGVLTVGACNREDRRAMFSGWGAQLDVVAPGVEIVGCHARYTDFLSLMEGNHPLRQPSGAILDGDRYIANGSCSALPQVTGLASLLWQRNPGLTAQQIRNRIVMSCDDLEQPGWDRLTGAGRINVKKALQLKTNHFLEARVTAARVIRKKKLKVIIRGMAKGSHFQSYRLQIAFGKTPQEKEWRTVQRSQVPIDKVGVLASLPLETFEKWGQWSIRCVAKDRTGRARVSQGTMTLRRARPTTP